MVWVRLWPMTLNANVNANTNANRSVNAKGNTNAYSNADTNANRIDKVNKNPKNNCNGKHKLQIAKWNTKENARRMRNTKTNENALPGNQIMEAQSVNCVPHRL